MERSEALTAPMWQCLSLMSSVATPVVRLVYVGIKLGQSGSPLWQRNPEPVERRSPESLARDRGGRAGVARKFERRSVMSYFLSAPLAGVGRSIVLGLIVAEAPPRAKRNLEVGS